MAPPNLVAPTFVRARSAIYLPTTSIGAALSNAANSNLALRVTTVYCCNVDSAAGADITLTYFNGSTDTRIGFTVTVPFKGTQLLVTRNGPVNIEEGHSIRALANFNSRLEMYIAYEEIG